MTQVVLLTIRFRPAPPCSAPGWGATRRLPRRQRERRRERPCRPRRSAASTALRAYYGFVPKGVFSYEYTVRLNNPGVFQLPPSRVEAMYAPEMYRPHCPMPTVEVR